MQFNFAHISDVHLAPLPRVRIADLMSKRLTGYLNWKRSRHRIHQRSTIDAITSDITAHNVAHWAITGDLVNLGLPDEIVAARDWLASVAPPEKVSLVPGNHDAYVRLKPAVHWSQQWSQYFASDAPEGTSPAHFPSLRVRDQIAFIGLSSAIPTLPFSAAGALDDAQLERLPGLLDRTGEQGLFRVVLIHHPPVPGLTSSRRALRNAAALEKILVRHGSELVLYGHNHKQRHTLLETVAGTTHIVGVPSASSSDPTHPPLAAYNLFKVERSDKGWGCTMHHRGLRTPNGPVEDLDSCNLEFRHVSSH